VEPYLHSQYVLIVWCLINELEFNAWYREIVPLPLLLPLQMRTILGRPKTQSGFKSKIFNHVLLRWPITTGTLPMVLDRSSTAIVGSNPARGTEVEIEDLRSADPPCKKPYRLPEIFTLSELVLNKRRSLGLMCENLRRKATILSDQNTDKGLRYPF
jgi:hypothetical protein